MRSFWRRGRWAGGALIALGLTYFLMAMLLGMIPGRAAAIGEPTDYHFYACDNGVHVDIILPAVGGGRDWFGIFPPRDFAGDVTGASHLALGWGAKAFFATTKEWRDIRPGPVLRALFWRDSSVVHVTYHGDPQGLPNCRALATDQAGADAMFRYIDDSLDRPVGQAWRELLPGYWPSDAFYAAMGRYSLFRTCNVWSAELLRESGRKMALWSPFSFQVMGLLASP
ncbi:TIGR02117 family protein [Dongia sp.]|uniref:TIGR02117 family protein n=1 Tax=Dongia sp. TaxID=1977262 RepID=UPI0034A2DCC2